MSLEVDGVWKAGVWATTVWAAGVWREGPHTPAPQPPDVVDSTHLIGVAVRLEQTRKRKRRIKKYLLLG